MLAKASVALRKESVDRNISKKMPRFAVFVALRKESVDRNIQHAPNMPGVSLSLSARRAWIEILYEMRHTFVSAGRSPQGERG